MNHYLWGELFTPFGIDNQSFYAVLTRLFWGNQNTLAGQSNQFIRISSLVLLAVMSILATWSFFKSKAIPFLHDLRCFSLLGCVLLFASPVSEVHHFTPLFLLTAVACLSIEYGSKNKWLLILAGLLCTLLFSGGMIFHSLAYVGLPLWGALLFWLAIWFDGLTDLPPRSIC